MDKRTTEIIWNPVTTSPDWKNFDVIGADLVRMSVRIRAPMGVPEKAIVIRFRFLDQHDREIHFQPSGFGYSEQAGVYVYPHVRGEILLRKDIPIPDHAKVLSVALQHWKGAVPKVFEYTDLIAKRPSNLLVVEKSEMTDSDESDERFFLDQVEELSSRLVRRKEKLPEGAAPMLEEVIEKTALDNRNVELANGLGIRRLMAGRSDAAVRLAPIATNIRILREKGRLDLLTFANGLASQSRPLPKVKGHRLLYPLHNCLPYNSGGYATRAHGLLKGFRGHGWEVMPVARPGYPEDRTGPRQGDQYTRDGIEYHFLDIAPSVGSADQIGFVVSYADQMEALPGADKIGAIVAPSFFYNGLAGRLLADRIKVPLIYEMRGLDWFTAGSKHPEWQQTAQGRMMRDLELATARAADHVFAITDALRKWLIESGISEHKISLLPNGCAADEIKNAERDDGLADTLGIRPNTFVVGYVGSVVFYEGIDLIIDAVELARHWSKKDIVFLLVGDGPEYNNILEKIETTQARSFVIATGRVPHEKVSNYYSLIDVVAMARRDMELCHVISPIKPVECMASGKLLITSDVAAVREMVDDSDGGALLFRAGDAADLATKIIDAMSDGDGQISAVKQRGQVWARTKRSWSALAGEAIKVIKTRFE